MSFIRFSPLSILSKCLYQDVLVYVIFDFNLFWKVVILFVPFCAQKAGLVLIGLFFCLGNN